jgi:hypothetical protein
MNIARTITAVFSYGEIVMALQAAYPESIHVMGMPLVGGAGVSAEVTGTKGLMLKYTTNVAGEVAEGAFKLLKGPSV